eukprot:gene10314-2730_t
MSDSDDNSKTYYIVAGGVALASLLGIVYYTTSSSNKKEEKPVEKKQVEKVEEEKEEKEEKVLQEYENENLLVKFKISNKFKIEDSKGDFIHIFDPTKNNKTDIKIIVEELKSGFEEYISHSCSSLEESNPISNLTKTMKKHKNFESVQIEYEIKGGNKEGCIMLKSKEKCFIFQLSPFNPNDENLKDLLNSIEELYPKFKNDKFVFKSTNGFQISICDLNFEKDEELKEKNVLFSFKSENEKLELKKINHSKKGNLKHEGVLETIKKDAGFISEISFKNNFILSFRHQDENRTNFLLDCFNSFEFNDLIKNDSFVYKNEKFNFNFEFPSYFKYSELLWSNDFLLVNSKNIETTISTIKVPNHSKNKKERSKELIQFTKHNLNESFANVLNISDDEKTGLVECDLSDELGDFKIHIISNLFPISGKEDLCLNIKSTIAILN